MDLADPEVRRLLVCHVPPPAALPRHRCVVCGPLRWHCTYWRFVEGGNVIANWRRWWYQVCDVCEYTYPFTHVEEIGRWAHNPVDDPVTGWPRRWTRIW